MKLLGGRGAPHPKRQGPVVVEIGGICWDHLRYTAPGSLSDEELGKWGYEPDWADETFVAECREAMKNPIRIVPFRKEGQQVITLEFPSYYHAEACLEKLRVVGRMQSALHLGFPPEIREQGRCFLVGAARGFRQLKEQIDKRKIY